VGSLKLVWIWKKIVREAPTQCQQLPRGNAISFFIQFQSNHVGIDVTGKTIVPNELGLILYGSNNIIGGCGAQGNLFGGYGTVGVALGSALEAWPSVPTECA